MPNTPSRLSEANEVHVPAIPLEPSSEELLLRSTVANIVNGYGHSYFMEASRDGVPMHDLWDELGSVGFLGLNIPEEYGGGGAGLTELAIVLEELSAGGCPDLSIVLTQGIAGSVLARHGTDEQRSTYLPGIAAGRQRFAFALTEPDAGSNTHKMRTTARRDGRDWVLRGTKHYISGVNNCDHFLIAAQTGRSENGRGKLSLFVLEPDASGLHLEMIPTALSAPERQFALFLDDVRVPKDNIVGGVDNGLAAIFDGLNPERVLSAVICTGIARYALTRAVAYVKERYVWDVPIGTHQAVQHPLSVAKIELEAARMMVWRASSLFDAGIAAGEASNMAKYLASQAGYRALDAAIQVHGGNGLADAYGLADLWGIVRLQQIAPVSSEMVLNYVAQHTLGLPRSY